MAAAARVGFTIALSKRRGLLVLNHPVRIGLVDLETLELEIPGLRFPFTVSAGVTSFRNRRCRLINARLTLDEATAAAWLAGRLADRALALVDLTLRLTDGALALGGVAQARGRRAPFRVTGELRLLEGTKLGLALSIDVEGGDFTAQEIGLALLTGLGAPQRWMKLEGPLALTCDPLRMFLFRALPSAGWRLPALDPAHLQELRVTEGRLVLEVRERETTRPSPPALGAPRGA